MEKIKNLSLRWKFGAVVLVTLLFVIFILFLALRGYLNREFEALYGGPSTTGVFVAKSLAKELEPILEENIDSQEVDQTVEAYKKVYGTYGVYSIFLLDEAGQVIIASPNREISQGTVNFNNPVSEDTPCKSFVSKKTGKKYFDCGALLQLAESSGAVRVGVVDSNPESPGWQEFISSHTRRVSTPILLISLLLVIIVTVLLTLAFWFLMVSRVVSISQATERMSFGDLETVVEVKSQDEIGILEDALERMRANLKDAIERLKRRKQ